MTRRLAIDIGGTFTDIVLLDEDGGVVTRKISSSTDDYARAIEAGLRDVFEETGLTGAEVVEVLHGTTVASNAILERKGARTGLITTRGFRDVLEIRRLRMPRLYDLRWQKPPTLVERRLRVEVGERVNAKGDVVLPLDDAEVECALDHLLAEGVEAIAVCLVHSYANPIHEERIRAIVRCRAEGLPVCISADVLPEIREYERTSTTVINTYVMPAVRAYVDRLEVGLRAIGIGAPLLMMQSNGGLMTARAAAERPVHIIESGPAAGVVGAQVLARRTGLGKVITFDMGGTTAKAAIVEDGEVARAVETQVGGGIIVGSRLLTGAGYLLRVPAIDLAEVGAGGGSIVWIDAGGSLRVGPESAGALPGPLCYDLGGSRPTVTDANVILGYLNPSHLAGGAVRLNAARAAELFEAGVASPLGLPLVDAAYGAHLIAASNMIRAIRAVSSERGRDPREYTFFAFGGNGPLFAAGMARALGIRRIVVPPAPGLFSAFGLLYSDVEHHYVRSWRRPTRGLDPGELDQVWHGLETEALAQLGAEGFTPPSARVRRSADLCYRGQSFELTVPAEGGAVDEDWLARLEDAFGREHERTYGHRGGQDEPIDIVSLRVSAQGVPDRPRVPGRVRREGGEAAPTPSHRRVYFGAEAGWLETAILRRVDLAHPREGPCIVEEYDATCVVPPGARAALDEQGNIVIELGPESVKPMTPPDHDPIGLELFKNALLSIADEMALTVLRTAYSGVLKDNMDYSTAVTDAQGRTIAHGLTLPAHISSFPDALAATIARFGDRMRPGDVYALNDPFEGGMHLPDVFILKPIFHDGERIAFAATVCHQTDMGGRVPGSNASDSTEIYQEGLRIPPVKMFDAGEPNETLFRLIEKNVRLPERVKGDMRAQLAACHIAEASLLRLIGEHGPAQVKAWMEALLDYAERMARAAIAELPDGEWSFTDHVDDDGIDFGRPIPLVVTLKKQGDHMVADWTGTSPQVKGAINNTLSYTKAATYTAILSVLSPDLLCNAGFYRAIEVVAPPGTIANAVLPAACAARGLTGFRMVDTCLGALAQMLPDRVMAASEGGNTGITIGGYHADRSPFVFVEFICSAWGGRPWADGLDGNSNLFTNMLLPSAEVTETEHPVEVLRSELVPDSGGPGRYRGGMSIRRDYRLLEEEAVLQVRADRQVFRPYGLQGGMPGAPSRNLLNPDGQRRELPSKLTMTMRKGDVFRHEQPGGGGWGDPLERPPDEVLRDVRNELVSVASAEDHYGVVIDHVTWTVDAEATDRRREALRAGRLGDPR